MQGLIELTYFNTGAPFVVAVHAIGVFEASRNKNNTIVTLSFGSSGKEEVTVKESYDEVKSLIEQAQMPLS